MCHGALVILVALMLTMASAMRTPVRQDHVQCYPIEAAAVTLRRSQLLVPRCSDQPLMLIGKRSKASAKPAAKSPPSATAKRKTTATRSTAKKPARAKPSSKTESKPTKASPGLKNPFSAEARADAAAAKEARLKKRQAGVKFLKQAASLAKERRARRAALHL